MTAIDVPSRDVILGDGAQIHYDRLLLATGALPRRLDVPGSDLAGIHLLRTVADAEAIGDRAVAARRVVDVLAAYVAAGGSVQDAADLVNIRPSTVKRHLADLRARSGLTTEQPIYAGRAEGWLVVPSLESG